MIAIRELPTLDPADLQRLGNGYTSFEKYQVARETSRCGFSFKLERVTLSESYLKHWDSPDTELLQRYQGLPQLGYSYGAYDRDVCVGLVLAEPQLWNLSLWLWELHVAETCRRQGIGRRLVEAVAHKGRLAGLRTLVCETQNTNVPAIDFYRQVGFELDGLDLSYYTNTDFHDGEIALFMKLRLD